MPAMDHEIPNAPAPAREGVLGVFLDMSEREGAAEVDQTDEVPRSKLGNGPHHRSMIMTPNTVGNGIVRDCVGGDFPAIGTAERVQGNVDEANPADVVDLSERRP